MKRRGQRTIRVLRTRIKNDIVCEFLPPANPSHKVIILCGGMPNYPGGKNKLWEFLSQKGYWVFIPRYRGTWESGGAFLKHSPERDVLDVVTEIPRGFKDPWSGKTYRVKRPEIYLVGSSFGGGAVILASRDPHVRKTVALSPVTDWRVETSAEPIDKLQEFTRLAFGNAYRGTKKDFDKLRGGAFYNPAHEVGTIDGSKLLIFHAKDDKIVPVKTSIAFARATGARLILLPRGGHLSISNTIDKIFWGKIKIFLSQK